MRATLLVALWAAVTWAQGDPRGRFGRTNSRCAQGRSDRGLACEDLAFFEFAPQNGAGMGSACACTTPTGAKGEALTFTRTGDATCSRQGLATTGIQNGDLTVCTANQPRVEPSGGVLGLRVEGARTNLLPRSEELNNAAWLTVSTTVTPNTATSPSGTLTADRLELVSGATAQVYQTTASLTGPATHTFSVYLRSNSGSPQVYCFAFQGAGAPNANTPVTLSTTSWTRCTVTLTTAATATVRAAVGWDTAIGMVNPGNVDILAWGAQFEEAGTYATSYIPTVASAVTRNAETANIATTGGPGVDRGSIAASVQFTSGTGGVPYVVTASNGAPPSTVGINQMTLYSTTGGGNFICFVGNSVGTLFGSGTAAFVAPFAGIHRGWCSSPGPGAAVSGQFDTNSMSASGATSGTFGAENNISIGSVGTLATTHVDGIITRVCRDPDTARCR